MTSTSPASADGFKEPIESTQSRARSFVKFVNRTRVPVDIIWRGFNGEHIRYYARLAPAHHFSIDTFEGHPWQVWNSDTLQLLNVGGNTVFYPQKWKGERQRTAIYIDEPLYDLVRLCLETIKSLVSLENTDKLDIPKLLKDELKKRRRIEIQDYVRSS